MSAATWVGLNPDKSPTAASVQLLKDLEAIGEKPINLGQGREIENCPEDILPKQILMSTNSAYNVDAGGPANVRETIAAHLEHFYGMPATGANTFVLQTQGREGLDAILSLLTPGKSVCMDELHWPMYDDIVAKHNFVTVDSLDRDVADAAITNSPNNPTGKNLSLKELIANRAQLLPGALDIYDTPYGYAAPDNPDGRSVRAPNYKAFLHPEHNRPWAIVVSFSKSHGTATPGLCAVVVHPSLVAKMSKILTSGIGLAYAPEFFAEVAKGFAPEKNDIHHAHFNRLRGKYIKNRITMDDLGLPLLAGDPGMTAAIDVTQVLGATGRKLITDTHGERDIRNIEDLVEAGANLAKVVTVAQAKSVLRVALAAKPENFGEAATRLNNLFTQLRGAPRL
ncbi:MAG TPA: aminotransferase class I/II-fold pyridoxal phosphate-dependent enzyme [Alphaproteobacteria bacterium]|nr:hypothetical protein [Rhodospirillaceae bacterium]HRJ11643.1 aminotransferase class I/II-fold pyridoxal phosphate-dependent enzyme [Alphaproteobacteria bacterium]